MYEPKWPFLLMYGSHNMRHTGFSWVDGLSTDPRDLGRYRLGGSKPHHDGSRVVYVLILKEENGTDMNAA